MDLNMYSVAYGVPISFHDDRKRTHPNVANLNVFTGETEVEILWNTCWQYKAEYAIIKLVVLLS